MKHTINKLLCRLFGHTLYEEEYAERRTTYRHRHPIYFYRIIHRTYCPRCGFEVQEVRSRWMRRSEMLKEGWFIEKK